MGKEHAAVHQGEDVFATFLGPQTESQIWRPTLVAGRQKRHDKQHANALAVSSPSGCRCPYTRHRCDIRAGRVFPISGSISSKRLPKKVIPCRHDVEEIIVKSEHQRVRGFEVSPAEKRPAWGTK
jgi:hypothetical protein